MEERWRQEQEQQQQALRQDQDQLADDAENIGTTSPSHPRSRPHPVAYGSGESQVVLSAGAEMPIENVQVCKKRGQDFKAQIYLRMKTKNITKGDLQRPGASRSSTSSAFSDERPDFGRFAVLGIEVDARFLFPRSTIKFRKSDLDVTVPCIDPDYNTGCGSKVFAADSDQRVYFLGRGHPNALQIDHGLLRERRKSARAYGLRCLMLPGVPPPTLMDIFTEDVAGVGGKAGQGDEEAACVPALQSHAGRNAASQRGRFGGWE